MAAIKNSTSLKNLVPASIAGMVIEITAMRIASKTVGINSEGTAQRWATGLEPPGGRKAGRSIRLPSAAGN